jgi:hypothetical protein
MKNKFETTMFFMGVIGILIAGAILYSFLGLKATIQGAAVGRNDAPVCLWQASGSGKDLNHLITDADQCARLFERYSSEGLCSDEAGSLIVNDNRGNPFSWNYETSCSKIVGGKRFTVMR